MTTLLADLSFAFRLFRRAKAFYAAVLLLLIGGVASTSAVCAIVGTLIWKPLPFAQPEQLNMIWATREQDQRFKVSVPDFNDWKQASHSFSHMAALRDWAFLLNRPNELPLSLYGLHVSGEFFETLGVQPLIGRLLSPADDLPDSEPVAVISEIAWAQLFSRDPSWIGRTIRLDHKDYRLVGVVGDSFHFGTYWNRARIWTTFAASYPKYTTTLAVLRDDHEVLVTARRRPGVSQNRAQAELEAVARRITAAHPGHEVGVRVLDLDTELRGQTRNSAWVLLVAVGLVFLAVCSNVSSLLLSRIQTRRGELATRVALGASPERLVRQLMTETLTLFLLAFPASALIAATFMRFFEAMLLDPQLIEPTQIPFDWSLLLICLSISGLAGVVCAALPAFAVVDRDLAGAVKRSALGSSLGRAQKHVRGALVVAQVALAIALLSGGGLAAQAFYRVLNAPLGFEPNRVILLHVLAANYPPGDLDRVARFYDEVLRRTARLPGVLSVAVANAIVHVPFEAIQFEIMGGANANRRRALLQEHNRVTPGYFSTLGIPLLAGRNFSEEDRLGTRPVIIVSESVEKRYFSEPLSPTLHPALGRSIRLYGEDVDRTIVGIVGNVRGQDTINQPRTDGYLPFAQSPFQGMHLLLRTNGNPAAIYEAPRVIRSIDPNVAVTSGWWFSQVIGGIVAQRSLATGLLLGFAGAALLLCAVGIYGLASQLSLQRTREIGIRLALGSPPLSAAALLVRAALRVLMLGVPLGLLLALGVGQLIARNVLEAEAFDFKLFLGVSALVVFASGAACALPALRALRISPASALRYE
ncbi:MAG TPA: ADOP family duplicated permease [Polyangiaceae bacterium]|nr:ADOP family duplicated permease [Polyangiaceae bacterium]